MKKIYLHIGTPKTGTTTIQKNLINNRKVLNKTGYDYPTNGLIGNAHHNLGFELSSLYKSKPKAGLIFDICQEIQKSSFHKFIISSEVFTWLTKEEIFLLKAKLSEFKVFPVICLRRQDNFFASFWSHRIINNLYNKSFTEFYGTFIRNRATEEKWSLKCAGCYDKLLSNWSDVFEKENIRIYLNDLPKGNLLEYFFDCCNINYQEIVKIGFQKVKNSNVSPTLEILHFIQVIIRECSDMSPEILLAITKYIQRFARLNLSNEPKRYALDALASAEIIDFYKEVNEKIAVEYFGREKLFHDKVLNNELSSNNVLDKHYVTLFTQLMNWLSKEGYLSIDHKKINENESNENTQFLFDKMVSRLETENPKKDFIF